MLLRRSQFAATRTVTLDGAQVLLSTLLAPGKPPSDAPPSANAPAPTPVPMQEPASPPAAPDVDDDVPMMADDDAAVISPLKPADTAALPAPPAPAASRKAPSVRYHYKNPITGGVEGPWKLSAFKKWVGDGAIAPQEVATLRLWPQGATPESGVVLADLLVAKHGERRGAAM